MNFEELLKQKNNRGAITQPTLFGALVKWKGDDGKYVNAIELRHDLTDAAGFMSAIEAEEKANRKTNHKQQLHFELQTTPTGEAGVQIEAGSVSTIAHLMDDNPAIVASKNFCKDIIEGLLTVTTFLNGQGIYHLCYSPDNIFLRRNSNIPLLLLHGSAYATLPERNRLWKNHDQYIAPEVLEGSEATPASDVYSIGRFMEYLYSSSDIPIELRSVVKKATAETPDQRYENAGEMMAALGKKRMLTRIVKIAAAAIIAAGIVWAVSSSLMPQRYAMDYLAPAPKEDPDSALNKGFDENMELALLVDSLTTNDGTAPGQLSAQQEQAYKEHQSKAEEIFRRQYTKQAERILARLYGKSRATMTQNDFVTLSATVTDELMRAQQQLTEMTNLSPTRSQLIASDIIDQVTNRLEARQRQLERKEEERLREATQKKMSNDAINNTIHESINPSKNNSQPTNKIDQGRALRVEEELKELEK